MARGVRSCCSCQSSRKGRKGGKKGSDLNEYNLTLNAPISSLYMYYLSFTNFRISLKFLPNGTKRSVRLCKIHVQEKSGGLDGSDLDKYCF